jgi:hypothetical protein
LSKNCEKNVKKLLEIAGNCRKLPKIELSTSWVIKNPLWYPPCWASWRQTWSSSATRNRRRRRTRRSTRRTCRRQRTWGQCYNFGNLGRFSAKKRMIFDYVNMPIFLKINVVIKFCMHRLQCFQ